MKKEGQKGGIPDKNIFVFEKYITIEEKGKKKRETGENRGGKKKAFPCRTHPRGGGPYPPGEVSCGRGHYLQ